MSDIKADLSKAASSAEQSAVHAENRFLATLEHNWYWLALGALILGFAAGKLL